MTRFIVYGAGAIGGPLAASLFEAGHDVVAVARGSHYEAIAADGLRVDTPEGAAVCRVPVADHPSRLEFRADDIVLLAMKSQDTAAALGTLAGLACLSTPIVCVQNGVENERAALRLFPNVYGVLVITPGTYLSPGVVVAPSSPVRGVLDVGRYPHGLDAAAHEIASAFESARYSSRLARDIQRWKYAKLLNNLVNAAEVVLGDDTVGRSGVVARARQEALDCYAAAGIGCASDEDMRARIRNIVTHRPVRGRDWHASSSLQSVTRGAGSVECDYLNGEIVLLGRCFGVPTPVNELLQRLAGDLARQRRQPGALSEPELLELTALATPSPAGDPGNTP
jgi:2-dehydropantoate 2-reductase